MIENPSGPDPDAVRKALAEIDEAVKSFSEGKIGILLHDAVCGRNSYTLMTATRAWLALQDGEASE